MHTRAHRQEHTADQKGIWLSNMKKKTKGVIVSCLPWTPGAMANAIIWKAPLSVCHGCGFHVRQKLLPKAAKSPPSLIWFLSPLLSPVTKRSGQCSLISHFWVFFFFCSSEDFQISLATVPHLPYALGVHICSWQRCDFVPEPLSSLSNPTEMRKINKASLSASMAFRSNPCPCSLLYISHLSADGALPVRTGMCTAQGLPFPSKSLRIRLPFLGSSPWGTAAIAAPCWVSEKEGKQLFQRCCRRRWRKTPAGSTEATMHTVYCCWELRRASASLSCSSLELVLGSGALSQLADPSRLCGKSPRCSAGPAKTELYYALPSFSASWIAGISPSGAAGKVKSLWTCSRSVTTRDGSHTILSGLTPLRGLCLCLTVHMQLLLSYHPRAGELVTSPSQGGLASQNTMWKHMHTSPVLSRVFIQGTFLVLWESLRNLHPPDMLLQCPFTVKTNLSSLASGIKSSASKEALWRQCKSVTSEMGYILARKTKSGYLFSASLSWIQSSVSQTIFLAYYMLHLIILA